MRSSALLSQLALLPAVLACGGDGDGHDHDSCYGPFNPIQHVRHVPRMQPGANDAPTGPTRQLEWGQLNVFHSTDTHGWLLGHIKESRNSADWGDLLSFYEHTKAKAEKLDVDLLWIDTGDLHDGTGLSDATNPDGLDSMPIFDQLPFDLMCIGNHELYLADITNEMFVNWAKKWDDRYLTSNVDAWNATTQQYEPIGRRSRYWTTPHGLRIKAYCVLYTFTGNSNFSRVTPASDMIQQQWFIDDLNADEPVDVILLAGHNAPRDSEPTSTFKVVHDAIRAVHPDTPVMRLGGHLHHRDFTVHDDASVGLQSGRYCETLGFLSMSGFNCSNSGWEGVDNPKGVPNPDRPATPDSPTPWRWARRYLDFARRSFAFHSQTSTRQGFDSPEGVKLTKQITQVVHKLGLDEVIGCVPNDFCISCAPFNDTSRNIFGGVLTPALAAIVVNPNRTDKARHVFVQTGSVRFDLIKGPYYKDDDIIVSPFTNVFMYIADVPFSLAKDLLAKLNAGTVFKRSSDLASMPLVQDACVDPLTSSLTTRDLQRRDIVRRQETLTPGYNTTDDWGNDGDDTPHSTIPSFSIPHYFDAQVNFPENGDPDVLDVIFPDFVQNAVIGFLGGNYTADDVKPYISSNFTLQDYLEPYARMVWSKNKDNCPIA